MLMCAALPSSSWCLRLERFGEFRISQVKLTCRYRRCGICIVFLSGRIVCRGSVSSRYTRKGEWSRGYVLGCLPSGVWRSRAEGEGLTRGGSPGGACWRRRWCHLHHGRWLLLRPVRGGSPRHLSLRRPSHRPWVSHLQFRKCSFYSPRTLPSAVRAELDALGISPGGMRRTPEGDEATQTEVCITQPFLPGITVGGGPLGHEAFIRQYMSTLTAGFVSYIRLRSISSSPPRRSRLGPACTAPYRPGWISGCSTSRRRRRRPRATRVRPEPPMSSRRERRRRGAGHAQRLRRSRPGSAASRS